MHNLPLLFSSLLFSCGSAPTTSQTAEAPLAEPTMQGASTSGDPSTRSDAPAGAAAAGGRGRGKAGGGKGGGKGGGGKAGGVRGSGVSQCEAPDLTAHMPAVGPWLTVEPGGGLALHFFTGETGPAKVRVEWKGGAVDLQSSGDDGMHHLRLDGVPASTPLTYRIADAKGRSSPDFTTHRVDPSATSLTVLAAADMQDDGRDIHRWREVAAAMLATTPQADLMVLPGDLAADDFTECWWLFFERGRDLFARVPLVMAVGNHDTPGRGSSPDSSSVRRLFDPQGDGPGPEIGVVEYGPARVLLLNSELPDTLAAGGTQYRWAEEALARPTRTAHTIAAFHRPAYDAGARFAGEQQLFRGLTRLFDGEVSLALMGHEHIYQRFEPLLYDGKPASGGRYGVGSGEGVAYMVLPAAGNNGLFNSMVGPDHAQAAVRDVLVSPELSGQTARVDQWHGFAQLQLDGGRIDVTTWRVGTTATVEERFVIGR